MQNSIRDYFSLLGVGTAVPDPTIPFDNEFHLLGLDETATDQEIARKARAQADTRSQKVNQIGQVHVSKRLDILLRDKINQAGSRFDGAPDKVREHRDELQRLRDRRLKDFAKDLCDTGKWTREQGADMLEPIALRLGVPADRLARAVSDALQSAGQWAVAGSQPPTPAPPPSKGIQLLPDSVAVASWRIPTWAAIVVAGIVIEGLDRWAGLAYGLLFLLLSAGKGIAERPADGGALRRNLKWGAMNACAASVLALYGLAVTLPTARAGKPEWKGEWSTDWGKMVFSGGASRVTATYASRTGGGSAEFTKDTDGHLDGKWWRGQSCDTADEKGLLRLVMDPKGQAFRGWFTYGLDEKIQATSGAENQISGTRGSPK